MKLTKDDMASILGVSRMNVYNLESKDSVPFKYYKKIEHLLSEEEKKDVLQQYYSMSFTSKKVNADVIEKQAFGKCRSNEIIVYSDINNFVLNFDKNAYNTNLNKLVVSNNNLDENCKIFVCCSKTDKMLIDVQQTCVSTESGLYAIKNNLSDKTVAFFAYLRIDELTGKTLIKLENGAETVMPETCKIIGRVVSKIVSV